MNKRMMIDSNPGVIFIATGLLTLGGYIFGGDAAALLQNTTVSLDLGFPEWLKDTFQVAAWAGACVSGFVVGHGWWVKYGQPWIKKRINKKKK